MSYPYVTKALRRIHEGTMPQGGFSNDTNVEDWYEQIVYAQSETLEKPSKEAILAEIEVIKGERGEV